MSLWGFLGAGLAYLLMTFAFIFGGIFWLCAEGNTLRETKRQSSIMSGIIVCTMGTWVIAFSIYIYGYFWDNSSHYYFYLLAPWPLAIVGITLRNHWVSQYASVKQEKNEKWQRHWREILGEDTEDLPPYRYDYGLYSGIWQANETLREQCFAALTHGNSVYERVKAFQKMTTHEHNIDDQILLSKLAQLENEIIQALEQHSQKNVSIETGSGTLCKESKRNVYRHENGPTEEQLYDSINLQHDLDRELRNIIYGRLGDDGLDEYFFLRAPLEELTENETAINWMLWGLVSNHFDVDPYQTALELNLMNAEPRWGQDERFVVVTTAA
ncbi:hypothetical protein [Vibrio parahaemolyticus]|uniref:hypothetical protein n=1 Tax=Vibrio parahaemolyticus TaxID=670 RepID=UPI001D5AEE7A|nr:hypothetical protein [Vibrio parahaemolyticus]EHH1223065.1 hypothetical protein [Vibrio parahaemolyticus]EIY8170756.1 hypothetical protein [Vibrio parahaemolyticus]EIY8248571.1 hypothetical protein [Vibrio parahaemolyticus]ELA8138976.1 hypothetical protein [Vibrio parahaemolyticus]MCR9371290.1 hypothetical protein [Vibrio parahaemolyticus]